ncbi:hypothetical protein CVM39_17870 [Pseudooceanicola antarcticus]|uniref:Uncharacterized protein n=1 Tax=Pseudooceanicola antarcticus TaxID=1247613 RepID=A0ABX4MJ89_9RHOB|nr:hypothetical protein CVM39_17870 [Pseudooceanicola antarcticus]
MLKPVTCPFSEDGLTRFIHALIVFAGECLVFSLDARMGFFPDFAIPLKILRSTQALCHVLMGGGSE